MVSQRDFYQFTIDAAKPNWLNAKDLWYYRELFYFFTWRDIKIKYKQTVLGFLWAILQPLLLMIIFTLFFGRALGIPSQNLPYPVYVFSGLLIWNFFSSGLVNAANSMVNNASIIKKIYFPRLIVPFSSVLVSVFDFLMAFILLAGLLIYYQLPVAGTAIIYWPAALLVAAVGTLGLGTWLAALNVKYRDFRYVIPFLVQLLFFVTPVIYPVSLLQNPILQYAVACSPMYAAIELFRQPITGIDPPAYLMMVSIGMCSLLLLIGILYFRSTEDFFADLA